MKLIPMPAGSILILAQKWAGYKENDLTKLLQIKDCYIAEASILN